MALQEYDNKLQASYATAMKLWISRFKEAQGVIRELEAENAALVVEVMRLRKELGIEDEHVQPDAARHQEDQADAGSRDN